MLPRVVRRRLHRRLAGVERIDDVTRRSEALTKLTRSIAEIESRMEMRRTAVPQRITYPEELPITLWRDELLAYFGMNAIHQNVGEISIGDEVTILE